MIAAVRGREPEHFGRCAAQAGGAAAERARSYRYRDVGAEKESRAARFGSCFGRAAGNSRLTLAQILVLASLIIILTGRSIRASVVYKMVVLVEHRRLFTHANSPSSANPLPLLLLS